MYIKLLLFITAGRACIILILKKKLRPRDANWLIKSSPPWEIPHMLCSLSYSKIATRNNINTVRHHWCIRHKHRKHNQKAFSKRQQISLRKRNKVQDVSRVIWILKASWEVRDRFAYPKASKLTYLRIPTSTPQFSLAYLLFSSMLIPQYLVSVQPSG